MNPEKNTEQEPVPAPEVPNAPDTPVPQKKKTQNVIIYIMILFIVAFLLMALSSLMQQRSNDEAFGKLEHSLSNMQAVQATQDQIIELQKQLAQSEDAQDALQAQIDALEQELANREDAVEQEQRRTRAMLALYNLQQNYLAREYDACMYILQYMEDEELTALLPEQAIDDATSPAARYLQLREAILNRTGNK